MKPQPNPMFWDVRMIELRLRRGETTPKEYQAYLDQLKDVSEKSTTVDLFDAPLQEESEVEGSFSSPDSMDDDGSFHRSLSKKPFDGDFEQDLLS